MKLTRGIITLAAVIVFATVGCDNGNTPKSPKLKNLSGNVTVIPAGPVAIGTPLTAAYDGTEKNVTLQWNRNGAAITDKTETAYTPDEAGNYTVTASKAGYNSKTSNAVIVTAGDLPPFDLSGNVRITPEGPVVTDTPLTAAYDGGEEGVTLQWKKDGEAIAGETETEYTPTVAGEYTVTAGKVGYNSKTSNIVTVTNPAILDLSGNVRITPEGPVVTGTPLTADYNGDEEGVTLQWKKDGEAIAGETETEYVPAETGSYTASAGKAGYNGKTSNAVAVLLALSGSVTITHSGFALTGTELTARYSGGEDVTFQWHKDGEIIGGETGETYTPGEAGTYTVTANATGYLGKISNAVTVLPGDGVIIVAFNGFGDEHIDLARNTENDISISQNTELYITVPDIYSSYRWFIDGSVYWETSNSMYLYGGGNFSTGIHTAAVAVVKDGVPYSKEVTFRVVR